MTLRRIGFALALVVGVYVAHALYLRVVVEDAFIAFRYARHVASGSGLVWNPGEAPVEGYTNFLWVVLCALAIRAGLSVTTFAQTVGIAAGVATIFYTWYFARRVYGQTPAVALLPCALLAVSGPAAMWAASGMEMVLFALAVTASCAHAARYAASGRTRHASFATAFLVVATLTRPEGLLVAVVLVALAIAGRRRKTVLGAIAVYAVVVAAYTLWRFNTFGQWLPNTYYAKVTGGVLRLARGAVYAGAFGVYFVLPAWVVWLAARRSRPSHPGTVVCGSVALAWALYVVWVGGDYMAMDRFFVPVLPLVYLLAGRAAEQALRARPRVAVALVTVGLVVTALHSTPLDARLFPRPPRQHGLYAGVETERWHTARLTLIGRYFATLPRGGDAGAVSLATDAIGAVSYYSGMRVYGVHGLVDPAIAHAPAPRGAGLGLPGHEKGDLSYTLSRRPTYVMVSRLFTRAPAGYPDGLPGDVLSELRRDYKPVSILLDDKENGERGYFTYYVRRGGAAEKKGAGS